MSVVNLVSGRGQPLPGGISGALRGTPAGIYLFNCYEWGFFLFCFFLFSSPPRPPPPHQTLDEIVCCSLSGDFLFVSACFAVLRSDAKRMNGSCLCPLGE